MSSDPRVSQILEQWNRLREQGNLLSAEELCKDCPELLEEVKRRIQILQTAQGDHEAAKPTVHQDETDKQDESWPEIEGYEILSVLGHGGMGVVYKARHLALNRIVALKMILSGKQASPQQRQRIRNEAEALARLSHPNIVQIYEVGEQDGCPYLCLEFVSGGTLAHVLGSVPHEPRQVAHMIEILARAIHSAHQANIVHRDLKPSNILLAHDAPSTAPKNPEDTPSTISQNREGLETWGKPKITDFGLAKRLDREDDRTKTRAILGTPMYMAPEQASGRAREAGPRADVYALGAILYEMLTGQTPFVPREGVDILDEIKAKDPVPPRRLHPRVPRDLQTICLNCLEKETEKRYATAEALADDLSAFLTGEKIKARPRSFVERMTRLIVHHPVISSSTVSLVLTAFALLEGGYLLALGVSVLALVALLVGGAIYQRRLQTAFRQLAQQHQIIEQHAERLDLVIGTTRRLLTATPLDALHLISQTATQLVNAESATIYLVDLNKKELWSKVVLGPNIGEIRLPLGKGIAGTVAETGQIITIDDAYADPRFNSEVDKRTGFRTRNLLTFPMRLEDGRILGVFQLVNKRDGAFSRQDIATLNSLTASATVVLQQLLSRAISPFGDKNDPTQLDEMPSTQVHVPTNLSSDS